eukprot:4776532-Pleurochrysis_carterae.AAC.1
MSPKAGELSFIMSNAALSMMIVLLHCFELSNLPCVINAKQMKECEHRNTINPRHATRMIQAARCTSTPL